MNHSSLTGHLTCVLSTHKILLYVVSLLLSFCFKTTQFVPFSLAEFTKMPNITFISFFCNNKVIWKVVFAENMDHCVLKRI